VTMKRWSKTLIICAMLASLAYAEDLTPLTIAYNEGQLRRLLTVCFVEDTPKQQELMALSTRFIRALSTATAIRVNELEAEASRGTAELAAAKAGLIDRCKQFRDRGEQEIRERDSRLRELM
jgi:hypothetical protein